MLPPDTAYMNEKVNDEVAFDALPPLKHRKTQIISQKPPQFTLLNNPSLQPLPVSNGYLRPTTV